MPPIPLRLGYQTASRFRNLISPGAAVALALTITLLIYWPGMHGGFVLDDYPNIVNNAGLHIRTLQPSTVIAASFSSESGALSRPLSMFSLALNYYLTGPSPYWMKLTNILIHCANGLLVYWLASLVLTAYRRSCKPEADATTLRWTAVAITTAWLLLPINLTAVLYVIQRMTSLSGMFVLSGLILYLRGRLDMLEGRRALWLPWTGIAVFGTLAVLAKESGALLPVYAFVMEWTLFRFRRPDGRRDGRIYLLFTLTLLLPGILGLLLMAPGQFDPATYANRPFTLAQRLLTEPRVVLDYVAWTLIPRLQSLSLYHDDYAFSRGLLSPPSTLLSILAATLLVAVAIWKRRRHPLVSLGILWFLGGQLLTATVFNLELVYEHRNYLPSLGLLIAVFPLLTTRTMGDTLRLVGYGTAAGLILLYAIVTALRAQEWSNPLTHATIAATEHPDSPRATYAIGRLYAIMAVSSSDSRFTQAAQEALSKAAAVPHADILPEQALLILGAKQHLPLRPAWWESMKHKLATRPLSAQELSSLTSLVDCTLRKECNFPEAEMKQLFAVARRANPDNADLLTINSNYVLNVLGNAVRARQLMVKTLELMPRVAQYWVNIIKLDIAMHRFHDAEREIQMLQALNHFGILDQTIEKMKARLHRAKGATPDATYRLGHEPTGQPMTLPPASR